MQSALLAGLPQAPSVYDPFEYPARAIQRRNGVLNALYEMGAITFADYMQAYGRGGIKANKREGDGATGAGWRTASPLNRRGRRTTIRTAEGAFVVEARGETTALGALPSAIARAAVTRELRERGRAAYDELAAAEPDRFAVIDAAAPVPEVDVDQVRIGEVLANLLTNAIRHAPRGGAVRVVVSPAPGQPGKMPFWHGEYGARAVGMAKRVGAVRRLEPPAAESGASHVSVDEASMTSLQRYVGEQRAATGAVPDERTIVVEEQMRSPRVLRAAACLLDGRR
jgi:hypothetical protein